MFKSISVPLSLLLLIAFVVGGCKMILPMTSLDGNGKTVTDSRSLAAFHDVELDGSYEAEISQDHSSTIRIEADSNLISHITTVVKNGKLIVSSDESLNPSQRMKVWISSPALTSFDVEGSADVHSATPITSDDLKLEISGSGSYVAEVHVKNLTTEINGSGKITLKGEASVHKSDISGSGDLYAFELPSSSTAITISGSGTAQVFVSDKLDADISGAGDVQYKGRVTNVHSNVSGSGKVEKTGN